ncbi:beta-ribofuranosylaminobenzene 5'-phosphate synthase [Methanobacterium sp. ACI-7]|uniref:beta-ribofuranosylaminobenzene 5'-phosphate synthase n=1 Tax=unclassified Methanobacterium TaxID=2627676 RepID=UPI0039C152BA
MIIRTPSRLHITLIDLNGSIGRMDGGVGLTVQKPELILHAKFKARGIEITFENENDQELIKEYREKIENSANKMLKFLKINSGIKFHVKSMYPAHSGLGSGTQISLAVGKLILKLHGHDLSAPEIAKLVGRGGTSGIGVMAFDHGGFIMDGGHSLDEKPDFLPSSASRASPAPLIARYDFPEDWKIIMAIPNIPAGASGPKEVNIFQKYCPVSLSEVQKLSHILLMKMMPSIVEQDIESFGYAVNEIQDTGFKKIELELQDPLANKIIERMKSAGAAGVGMSSFGPTIYAVTDNNAQEIASAAHEVMKEVGGQVIITKAQNRGAIIE